MGSKISYTDNAEKGFIPSNMKLGACLRTNLTKNQSIALAFDVNKLLVPTPPVYDFNETGNYIIMYGMDPDIDVLTSLYRSFYDAPGVLQENGERKVWLEEFHEINYSLGVEYWYDNLFALRGGYFFEHPTKGGREFFSIGAGGKYNGFGLDISYLIPTKQRHPLIHLFRISLSYNFDKSSLS